jgi:RNA polymerase sigma-32 factor
MAIMGQFYDPDIQRANRGYLAASMRTPLLSRDDEFALARRWRAENDASALHELVLPYMRLVVSSAARFRNYGLPMGDLLQEGNVGLMQAAMRFDPDLGIRFSTYAVWWIRSAMQDYILRNWSIVRTGTTAAQKTLFFNLRRLRSRIGEISGAPMSQAIREQIAVALKVKIADVEAMELRLGSPDQSLNAPLSEDSETDRQDILADARANPEEIVTGMRDGATRSRWLAEALSDLTPRERRIIQQRRLSEEGASLGQLGRELGVSKERVRQIEHQAFSKLKNAIKHKVTQVPDLFTD